VKAIGIYTSSYVVSAAGALAVMLLVCRHNGQSRQKHRSPHISAAVT